MLQNVRSAAGKTTGRDHSLVPYIVGALALSVVLLVPLINMVRATYRFQQFKQDLAESMTFAEEHGTLTPSDGDRFYKLIVNAGMGKPQHEVPNGGSISYQFGDGSTIELWKVNIDGKPENPGTLIRFTRADGSVFCYDTDQIEFRFAADALSDAKVV
jgi:hypothetical protein